MRRILTLPAALLVTLPLLLGAPAFAQPPDHTGPPTVEVIPLAVFGAEITGPILCDDRLLEFTEGDLVVRERTMPDGSFKATATFRDGVAVDISDGTAFRVKGAITQELVDAGVFERVRISFIGPQGEVHRGHADIIVDPVTGDLVDVLADRGDCASLGPEG